MSTPIPVENLEKHNSEVIKEEGLKLCEHNVKVKSSNESSDSKKTNSTCSSRSSNTSKNSGSEGS